VRSSPNVRHRRRNHAGAPAERSVSLTSSLLATTMALGLLPSPPASSGRSTISAIAPYCSACIITRRPALCATRQRTPHQRHSNNRTTPSGPACGQSCPPHRSPPAAARRRRRWRSPHRFGAKEPPRRNAPAPPGEPTIRVYVTEIHQHQRTGPRRGRTIMLTRRRTPIVARAAAARRRVRNARPKVRQSARPLPPTDRASSTPGLGNRRELEVPKPARAPIWIQPRPNCRSRRRGHGACQ
jgi:hypothetical protein